MVPLSEPPANYPKSTILPGSVQPRPSAAGVLSKRHQVDFSRRRPLPRGQKSRRPAYRKLLLQRH